MMQLEIINSHGPFTAEAIASFESRCKVTLPEQYVSFLRAHNGGRFNSEPTYSTIDKIPSGVGGVRLFFGITKNPHAYGDLRYQLGQGDLETIERVPHLLGVAEDACGTIFLCCKGMYQGKVYLRVSDGWKLYLVANSFDAFLDSISAPDLLESTILVFQAIEVGNIEALQKQIAEGVDIEARNDEQETLLMYACKVKSPRCVTWLVDAGARVDAATDRGEQPIHFATRSRALDCVRVLVTRGVDINAKTLTGESPLFIALDGNSAWERMAEFVVESGADDDASHDDGRSALGMAGLNGYLGVCTDLIERGANIQQAIAWIVNRILADSGAGSCAFTGLAHLGAIDALIDLSGKGFTDAMDQVLAIAPDRADFHQALRIAMHNPDADVREYAKDCLEDAGL